MDVIVVGSCNMDLISYVERLPKQGETILGTKFEMGYGGKGANQCVGASRLGARAAMVAKLGNDVFGNNYLQSLKDNNINADFVLKTSDSSTGVAPITVDNDGCNSIIVVSGANMLLNEDDVRNATQLIKASKVMVCQLEIQVSTTLVAMKLAKQHKVTTILNPAPAQESLPPEIYTHCDIFCPNESEAEILTGLPVTNREEAGKAIQKLLDFGCKTVVITMGSQGVVHASHDDPNPKFVPAMTVEAVDTTGAGDAFVGALAFFLSTMPNLDFQEMLSRSCEIASISVTAPGTQTSYKQRNELPEHLFQ